MLYLKWINLYEKVRSLLTLIPLLPFIVSFSGANPGIIYQEVLRSGRGTATSIDWKPNAEILAVGGSDGIWLYTPDFQDIGHFNNDSESVSELAWSPDGTKIASYNFDSIQIRNAQTGQLLNTIQQDSIWTLAWSPDGETLATSNGYTLDNNVNIWDVRSGDNLRSFEFDSRITALDWSLGGDKLVCGSSDGTLYVLDVATGQYLANLVARNTESVLSVAWSPDGEILASSYTRATSESALILWNMETYEVLLSIDQADDIHKIAWSPDGQQIATDISDGVIFWDALDATQRMILHGETRYAHALAWSPSGAYLAVGGQNNIIQIWDSATGQSLTTFHKHSNPTTRVLWRPYSNMLAIAYSESTNVDILDASTGALHYTLEAPSLVIPDLGISDLAWSPDGNMLAGAFDSFDDDTISIWDFSTGVPSEPSLINYSGISPSLAWSNDNRTLATAWGNEDARQLVIWDTSTGTPLNIIAIEQLAWIRWSPDGAVIATYTWENEIQLWDANTYVSVNFPYNGEDDMVPMGLDAWSPDGTRLIGVKCRQSVDGCALWEWNILNGDVSEPFEDDQMGSLVSFTLTWSPDGNFFTASDESKNVVYIWSAASGELLATLDEFVNPVNSLSWSSDSQNIAISDGVIHIWSIEYEQG